MLIHRFVKHIYSKLQKEKLEYLIVASKQNLKLLEVNRKNITAEQVYSILDDLHRYELDDYFLYMLDYYKEILDKEAEKIDASELS